MSDNLPRRFGGYALTAGLGEDAAGRVYRALRVSDRKFARLRILEGPEISEDAVLDAIQENGEIHSYLKNPAIARGVQMDSAEGIPFIAWSEEHGRTLDALLARARLLRERVPIEHGLLIAEKVATALDHGYNTTLDGERTLHGLVWPGFVSLSDDGETRLTGFGLAHGFFPSFSRPRFARDIGPYLAPEEREARWVARNSDVYSVGVMLFELLTGRVLPAGDPVAALKEAGPLPPEVAAVLRMALGEAAARYQSAGELRRELGRLLFSGPYAPSTFNLAYYVNHIFGPEIEEETEARTREALLDPAALPEKEAAPRPRFSPARPTQGSRTAATKPAGPSAAASPPPRPAVPARPAIPPPQLTMAAAPRSRAPLAIGGTLLVAAAVGGAIFAITRRPAREEARAVPPTGLPLATPTATAISASTAAMSAGEFQDEVSRRVAEELKKAEEGARLRQTYAVLETPAPRVAEAVPTHSTEAPQAAVPLAAPAAAPVPEPTAAAPPNTAASEPEVPRIAAADPPPVPREDPEIPAVIKTIVKPPYPPMALAARIGGTVVLRVLVSETGVPIEITVLRGAPAGLTEAAVRAVKRWTFTPARRGGTAIRSWTTVPIPFQP